MPDEYDDLMAEYRKGAPAPVATAAAAEAPPADEYDSLMAEIKAEPPAMMVKDVRERIFGPTPDYINDRPPVMSGAFRESMGPVDTGRTVSESIGHVAGQAGAATYKGITDSANYIAKVGGGIVKKVLHDAPKAVFGVGLDVGSGLGETQVTDIADTINTEILKSAPTNRTIEEGMRAKGYGGGLDFGAKTSAIVTPTVVMLAGGGVAGKLLGKVGVGAGTVQNVLANGLGNILNDLDDPMVQAANGLLQGIGSETLGHFARPAVVSLLKRMGGMIGADRVAHMVQGAISGLGMTAMPQIAEDGSLKNAVAEAARTGDWTRVAETVLTVAAIHGMAPPAAVKRAAADLRADVAAVVADPVRDEPTHVTLWRGRLREAEAAGTATREAARAESVAEGRAPAGPYDLPFDPMAEGKMVREAAKAEADAASPAPRNPREAAEFGQAEAAGRDAREAARAAAIGEASREARRAEAAGRPPAYRTPQEAAEFGTAEAAGRLSREAARAEALRQAPAPIGPDDAAAFGSAEEAGRLSREAARAATAGEDFADQARSVRSGFDEAPSMVAPRGAPGEGVIQPTAEAARPVVPVRAPPDDASPPVESAPDGIDLGALEASTNALRGGKAVAGRRAPPEAGSADPMAIPKVIGRGLSKAVSTVKRGADVVANTADDIARRAASLVSEIPMVRRGIETAKIARDVAAERLSPWVQGREFRARLAEKEGAVSLGRHDAKAATRDFANDSAGKPMTPEQNEIAMRHAVGEATDSELASAVGGAYVQRANLERSRIRARQQQLRDLGVLGDEVLARFEGGYLPRIYTKIEEAKAAGALKPPTANYAAGANPKAIPKVYQRKDLSPEIRAALGEIRDPATLYAAASIRQNAMIETAKFVRDVAANPKWSSATDTPGMDPRAIPNQPTRYGNLAGRFVHKSIRSEIMSIYDVDTGPLAAIGRFADTALREVKFGKTVLNPGTHGRNIIGNGFWGELDGQSWLDPENLPNAVDAVKILRSKPGDPLNETLRFLIKERVAGGDYISADVLDIAGEVMAQRGATVPEKADAFMGLPMMGFGKGSGPITGFPGADAAAKLYQLEDILPKVAAYVGKIRGKKIGDHWVEKPMSPSEAAASVRQNYPTFDATAWGARALHAKGPGGAAVRQLVPPFVAYTAEATRVMLRQAIKHPARFAALYGTLKAAQYGLAQAAGLIDDKDKDVIDAASPGYRKPKPGRAFLPVRDGKGDLQMLDVQAAIPLGDEVQSVVDMFTSNKAGDTDPGTRSMAPGGMFIGLAAQLWLNRSQLTGRDIDSSNTRGPGANPSDEQGERDTWKFIAENLAPNMFPGGYSWNKIGQAISQVPIDRAGEVTRDPVITYLDTLAGIKIRSVNVERDVKYKLLEIEDILKGKIQRAGVLATAKNIPEDERRREYDELVVDTMRLYNQALRVRGMPQLKPGDPHPLGMKSGELGGK